MVVLPQEIFDAIIDEAHEDKKTLKSCAVVASSFRSRSQRNLFLDVGVGRIGLLGDVPATFFTEYPHLVLYIRHLSIHVDSDFEAIVLALRSAQNIESLWFSGMEVKWGHLGNEVTLALFDCLTRHSLRRLILEGMPDVPAVFISAALASVPAVSLYGVRVGLNGQKMEQVSNSPPAPRLRHLVLQDFSSSKISICHFLFHPRNLTYVDHIERLTLRLVPESASHDERILAACAKSLKSLFILSLGVPLNIPILPFVLNFGINMPVSLDGKLPAHFSPTLSQIASSLPLLETLTLICSADQHLFVGKWADDDPLFILGAATFKSRTQLLHLRRVNCKLITGRRDEFSGAQFDCFARAMESRMAGLRGTGILTCTSSEFFDEFV